MTDTYPRAKFTTPSTRTLEAIATELAYGNDMIMSGVKGLDEQTVVSKMVAFARHKYTPEQIKRLEDFCSGLSQDDFETCLGGEQDVVATPAELSDMLNSMFEYTDIL